MPIQNVLDDRLRERIKAIIAGQNGFGVMRGMIYNNLQQWKMKLFEANHKTDIQNYVASDYDIDRLITYDNGDLYKFMSLTQADKEFILNQVMSIDEIEVSDEFLLQVADKTLKELNKVKTPTQPQKNLKADLEEALTGVPF